MNYDEVYDTYLELKNALEGKKQAIIKRNLEELSRLDENLTVLCQKIEKFDLKNSSKAFTDEQKENLKKLGEKIKHLEENNEILIKHSLDVINGLLSGILNIVNNDDSYDAKGKSCSSDDLEISSITEEA